MTQHRTLWASVLALVLVLVLAAVTAATAAIVETNISNSANGAAAPAITITPGNAVHVVWEEADDAIHHNSYVNGSWGSPQVISLGDSPAVASDSSSTVHLVWVDLIGSNFEVLYSKLPAGGTWSVPANVSLTSGVSALPEVATDQSGKAHIVWTDNSPGTPTIYYSNLSTGGPIPSGGGTAPDIAIDGSGARHVVWQDNGQPSVIFYTKNSGTGWSLPVKLSNNTTSDARAPQIALVAGTVYVTWVEGGRIRATEGTAASWSTPATISGTDTGAEPPSLQRDGLGNLHVAWADSQRSLRYTHRQPAGTWELPITLDIDPPGLANAVLVADDSGTAHVAWAEKATSWNIFYQTRPVPTFIGDLDANCTVDVRDVMDIAANWSDTVTDPAYDFDGDDQIGAGDIAQVAGRWRAVCP